MGANLDYEMIEDKELKLSDREIKIKSEAIFKKCAYDHGHAGYSGTLAEKREKGVAIHRENIQETVELAIDYLSDMNSKWEPADVIPVRGVGWLVGGLCSE